MTSITFYTQQTTIVLFELLYCKTLTPTIFPDNSVRRDEMQFLAGDEGISPQYLFIKCMSNIPLFHIVGNQQVEKPITF